MDYAVASYMDKQVSPNSTNNSAFRTHCLASSKKRTIQRTRKALANALAGGLVHVIARHAGSNYWTFYFRAFGELIRIPSPLGHSLGLHFTKNVHVKYDVGSQQHPFAYANRARWEDRVRRLGIQLSGKFGYGPNKGQEFQRWIQCDSVKGVSQANAILNVLEGTNEGIGC
jgi:hypothetical protein